MFVELMPLLAGRAVLITLAKADDKALRVNVIPAQAKADENPALSTPLTYTGATEGFAARECGLGARGQAGLATRPVDRVRNGAENPEAD